MTTTKQSPDWGLYTCAELAEEFVETYGHSANDQFTIPSTWTDAFKECSDFPKTKQKKQVWQWRYKLNGGIGWTVGSWLADEAEATAQLTRDEYDAYEKHAGPFEVNA